MKPSLKCSKTSVLACAVILVFFRNRQIYNICQIFRVAEKSEYMRSRTFSESGTKNIYFFNRWLADPKNAFLRFLPAFSAKRIFRISFERIFFRQFLFMIFVLFLFFLKESRRLLEIYFSKNPKHAQNPRKYISVCFWISVKISFKDIEKQKR